MKKKVVVLALAAAMMLSACGGSETAEVEANVEAEVEEAVEEVEEDAEEVVEEAVEEAEEVVEEVAEEAVEETEESVEEAVEEAEEAASDYVKGLSTETGWESEWIGLRFTAPEGMTMSTEEELNETMGLGQEILSEEFTEQQLAYAELATVYEMMCFDEIGTNVILMAEKLPMTLTAEQYVEILSEQITSVTAVTYEVVSSDEVVTIGGLDFNKLVCVADYDGTALCQDYYVTVIEDRAVALTLTYTDDTADRADTIISGFAAY